MKNLLKRNTFGEWKYSKNIFHFLKVFFQAMETNHEEDTQHPKTTRLAAL